MPYWGISLQYKAKKQQRFAILGRQTRLGREFDIEDKDGVLWDFIFEAKLHYIKGKSSHLAMITTGRELTKVIS